MPDLEIMWTKVDEAPALATYSLLPIVEAFVGAAGVSVKLKDISLAGRILATVPEKLTPAQRINDELAELGELTLRPEANIIKLPNISVIPPRSRSSRPRSRNCKARATTFRTIRTTPRRKPRRTSSLATPRCSAASSTRYCARAIPTAARPAPSSNTPATIRTRWAPGVLTPNRMWRTCRAAITTARKSRPPSRRRPTPASSWSAPTAPSRC